MAIPRYLALVFPSEPLSALHMLLNTPNIYPSSSYPPKQLPLRGVPASAWSAHRVYWLSIAV